MKPEKPSILVVDDKQNMLRLMSKVLVNDAKVLTAESGEEAVRTLGAKRVDAVLCDLKMSDMDGLGVLKACKRLQPDAEFVLMTAFASVGTAVEALKLGAYDYIAKPFDPEEAKALLLRALAAGSAPQTEESDAGGMVLPGVIARSEAMKDLASLVERIADSHITTLILGETGTGKERIARAVHELSPRANARFVAVNCAAIPAELLESELFGHARGAFTGASDHRKGLFEEANGGSLFLDEIGEMRPSLQAKLTRVLEERVIRRVGESKERAIDVRLIAATHCDLEAMVEAGSFREDLWYRLNVALVRLPPLRERKEDIENLAHHFLKQQRQLTGRPELRSLSPAVLEAFQEFHWPGNIRQLRSAVERASVVSSGEAIELSDLPPELLRKEERSGNFASDLSRLTWAEALEKGREEVGKNYLEAILRQFDGRIVDAAAHAGVERESLYRLLRKYGVEHGTPRSGGAKKRLV